MPGDARRLDYGISADANLQLVEPIKGKIGRRKKVLGLNLTLQFILAPENLICWRSKIGAIRSITAARPPEAHA
jgi:hypothetical protein